MKRTISITALQNSGIGSWSVKDDSPRGFHTAWTGEIKPGDQVVIDNYFTTVTEAEEPTQEDEKKITIPVFGLYNGIDTGDYGSRLNDYRDSSSYICDAISEIADNDTSIYYSDILNFISENPQSLADVIDEGLFDPSHDYDLYKHGQAAEYMMIEHDIYDHLSDSLHLAALDFVQYDMKLEEIPQELAKMISEWCEEADNNDRMNDIPDKIREYFADLEEGAMKNDNRKST